MINYIILKTKVLLYNFIVLCGYNNVLPIHYRNFIKQYAGYEVLGQGKRTAYQNSLLNVFIGTYKNITFSAFLENGLLKIALV